jgi:hypothetical protein
MDPLITNGVEPAHLRGAEKRSSERDLAPRRKRPFVRENARERGNANDDEDLSLDAPKHALDDLA